MKQTQDSFQVAAVVGGALVKLSGRGESREVALSLSLSRLIVKMVSVPKDADPIEFATPILQQMSPFPDEPLTVSCETVRETDDARIVIAAALPESASDDIGELLDAEKLNVTRIDALVLGTLRGLWREIAKNGDGRKLLLVREADGLAVVVLDGDGPSAIRAIVSADDLWREATLSLLEAEDFGGAKKLGEIIVVEPEETAVGEDDGMSALSSLAPVRKLTVGGEAALVGCAERAADPTSLNALPQSWSELLDESRFKRKLVRGLSVAGGVWLLIMGVLFGVPITYGFMTDYQKSLSKQHRRQYEAVREMKEKVDLVHKYSDHARGALEIMKAISDRLPTEITLSSWEYRRDDGVRVRGDSDTAEAIYVFKDAMDALSAGEGESSEVIFRTVNLTGPSASKGKYSFNIDCQYGGEAEE